MAKIPPSLRWASVAGAALWLGLCGGVEAAGPWGPFRGQFVDAETRLPIAGAAVAVVWRQALPLMHQVPRFYDAREAVSGADGRFEIAARRPYWLGFMIRGPEITYFAPRYRALREAVTPPGGRRFADPTVVEMGRLTTRQERERAVEDLPPHEVPLEAIPAFVRVLNAERRQLWLDLIGKPPGTREDCPARPIPDYGRPLKEIASAHKQPGGDSAVVELRDGRAYEVTVGAEIPGIGRVTALDDRRIEVEAPLSDADRDVLYCRGALAPAAIRAAIPIRRVR